MTNPARHWLAEQLDHLAQTLAGLGAGDGAPPSAGDREALLSAVSALVDDIGHREGITACVASHDGLAMAASGPERHDVDGLAALTQVCLGAGRQSAGSLALGPLRQVVVVGERHKVAMFEVGHMGIAVQAPVEVVLADVLG